MPFITETDSNIGRCRGEILQLQVMQTAELFELVLLHVDMRTLITSAQRVDRHWHQTIKDSPSLQKALFFLPDDATSSNSSASGVKGTREHVHVQQHTAVAPIRNPLLAEVFPAFFGKPGADLPREHGFRAQPFAKSLETFMAPGATWRRMLVQQNPPVHIIGRWKEEDNGWKGKSATADLFACGGGGLRMGQYYDLAKRNVVLEDRDFVYWTTVGKEGFLKREGQYKPSRDPEDDYEDEEEAADEYVAQKREFVARADLVLEQARPQWNYRPCSGNWMADRDWREFLTEFSYKGKVDGHEAELKESYSWRGGNKDAMNLATFSGS